MQATAFRPLLHRSTVLRFTHLTSTSGIRINPTQTPIQASHQRFLHPSLPTHNQPESSLSKVTSDKYQTFIFRSTSTDPYLNLSIEHYLLQNAHPASRLLFLYVNRPCVVIGRNQNPWVECALSNLGSKDDAEPDADVLLVRRRSGGGTVFHDAGNLNYSVIVPNDVKSGHEFKRRTHAEMVVRAVQNVQSQSASDQSPNVRVNDRNDIVMDDADRGVLKVSGSAFKLTRGRALHHGTLLFSSPNLGRISEMLRSPARAFISAKGVESVRSPVGNLFFTADPEKRREVREMLEREIVEQFKSMYANVEGMQCVEDEVGFDHVDESTEVGKSVLKGMTEMKSLEWAFESTPGFVFSTHPVPSEKDFMPPTNPDGLPEGTNVRLRVKSGIVQQAEIRTKGVTKAQMDLVTERLCGSKLHEISDWKRMFDGLNARTQFSTGRLVRWLTAMFPPVPVASAISSEPLSASSSTQHEKESANDVVRKRADGVAEIEKKAGRTVEEVWEV